MDSEKFKNRTYLVTGYSSGIGAAITKMLLDSGSAVFGISRRDPGTEKYSEGTGRCVHVECDLSDFSSLEQTVAGLLRKTDRLDGAILCHGFGDFGSLEEFSGSRIRALVDTNLTSTIMIARLLLPHLKRRGSGDMVVIGSESALSGGKRGAVYSATKFGLRGFMQSLRQECAASGVRISIVNPGMVRTRFFDALDFSPGESRENFLEPADVAEAVALLLDMPAGSVVDEINLSPQKKVVRGKKPD